MKSERPAYMACKEEYLAQGLQFLARFGKFTYTIKDAVSDNQPIKEIFIEWDVG